MVTTPLRASYSSIQDWRKCEQLYAYRHIDRIRPKVRYAAPELGTIIHEYFENYYKGAPTHLPDLQEWHKHVLDQLLKKHTPNLRSLASLAENLGAEEEAKSLLAIPVTAKRLLNAYFRVRGADDAKRHKIEAVELDFELEVSPGIVLPGKIDMVTKTRDGYWLWEHKTTGNVPSQGHRFRDLQTLIYKVAVEEVLGHKVSGVVWNYVKTTPPQPPKLLQRGGLSMAKGMTTTRGLYLGAIKKAELDITPYRPFLRQIEKQERETMFPRFTLPLVQAENILLRDYVSTVQQVQEARSKKDFTPVRTVDMGCSWCSYNKLCQAEIVGGSTDELVQLHFTRDQEKGAKNGR